MALVGWLDESLNPTLWIIVIYPLSTILFTVICYLRMTRLIQEIPVAPGDAIGARKPQSAAIEDASFMDYELILHHSADDVTEKRAAQAESIPTAGGAEDKPADAEDNLTTQSQGSPTSETTVSPLHQSEFFKAAVIFSIQVVVAHRLGVLTVRRIDETKILVDKIIGLLVMAVGTIALLMSCGIVGGARAFALRGYRTSDGARAPTASKDSLTKFIVFSFLTLLVPWFRILCTLLG